MGNYVTLLSKGNLYTRNTRPINSYSGVIQSSSRGIIHLENDTFYSNTVTGTVGSTTAQGGAVYAYATLEFSAIGCLFESNTAPTSGGALQITFAVSKVYIIGCTFISNGLTSSYGGAIHMVGKDSELVVESCVFSSNKAISGGGAIYGDNTTITLSNSVVEYSNNVQYGGALLMSRGTKFTVNSCTFRNCTSNIGGLLYLNGGSFSIWNSTAVGCRAQLGAVLYHVSEQTSSVSNCTFLFNSATMNGSVIYVTTGQVNVDNSTMISNTASNSGGAIYVFKGAVVVNSTYFSSNKAKSGSAVLVDTGKANFTKCTFENHVADSYGTVSSLNIYETYLDIAQCEFYNNAAYLSGGAIYSSGAFLHMYNTTLSYNSAKDGAGIFVVYGSAQLEWVVSTYNNNSGDVTGFGGGGYFSAFTTVTMRFCNFSYNRAINGNGGGILSAGVSLEIYNSTISYNKGISAAGMDLQGSGTVRIESSSISFNSGSARGTGLSIAAESIFYQ